MPVPHEQQTHGPQGGARQRLWPRRWRTRIGLATAGLALIGASTAWFSREQIAGNVIDDYLVTNNIPATYDIIAIGPKAQVIENLVVGDPARPDMTVRRVVLEMGYGWAGPKVSRVWIDDARLFGAYRSGVFSLGALDPLIFNGSKEPPSLPEIELTVTDARALIASDYGAVGIKLDGAGRLDDGFTGTLAATAPGIGIDDCRATTATLYGALTTKNGASQFKGPLRIGDLTCGGASLVRADIGTAISLKPDFGGAQGDMRIRGTKAAYQAMRAGGINGTARLSWAEGGLALAHDLALTKVTAPQGRFARLSADGAWRGAVDASRGQWEGTVRGAGFAPGGDLTASLAVAERGAQGTLIAPLLAKTRGAVGRALNGARFTAEAIVRHKGRDIALVIPEAAIISRTGTRVLAASQINAAVTAAGWGGVRGNILAGGEGLPNVNGRMEQEPGGAWTLRLAMAEYGAGANRLAIPRLTLRQSAGQSRGAAIGFDGLVTASGDLPGGAVTGLTVPLEGRWSQRGGLMIGTRCTSVRFAALALSGLALRGQAITLCPEQRDTAMLSYDANLKLSAFTGALALVGEVGGSPAQVTAERALLRFPAPFAVEGITARIGAPGSAVRMTAASLTGTLSGGIAGEFGGATAQLDVVPLDLAAMSGRWSFSDGALRVDQASFTLSDRPAEGLPRFTPLVATGASLDLVDNNIAANAALRNPASGRAITQVAIVHDLNAAAGRARLAVPGITFDTGLQPEDLSDLAKGVIAFADGTVSGSGRIDWTADAITSSGAFTSDGMDFAAAFGPVRGLTGTVVFTDLLNLTTAPDQTVQIAAINPGIEVLDGTVQFEVRGGTLLSLEDARFPFMGGQLQMRPLDMDFSRPEVRRYVFDIIGLDAARFVAQMELTNLGATGIFDGSVPIVFDADGNGRIEGGLLRSRAPGGNVAYIGELTYEDLGTMGNYAFAALRSLDYRQMSVGLNGNLAGEIITNFDFDGVRQGSGTSQNFITRRLAKLPIRFKVNVRAENFYELTTMVRSFWDVDFLGNPVDRGLLTTQGGRFVPANSAAPGTQSVQPSESEEQP